MERSEIDGRTKGKMIIFTKKQKKRGTEVELHLSSNNWTKNTKSYKRGTL